MSKVLKVVVGLFIGFGYISLVALFIGLPVKIVINYLFTPQLLMLIFGVYHLTFWKAFWLSVLCGILFKSSSSSK